MIPWKRKTPIPDPDEVRMTLGEHLEELRARVVRALVAIMVGAILCYVFIKYVMAFLVWPMYSALEKNDLPRDMIQTSPQEVFLMDLKVALIAGFIITAPYALVQVWGFIAAGLYKHERKWVGRFVPVSIALFFVGALFMLFVVAPVMLNFFLDYADEGYPDVSRVFPAWISGPRGMEKVVPQTQPAWAAIPPIQPYAKDPENPPEGIPWLNVEAHEVRIRYGAKKYTFAALREAREGNRVLPMITIQDYVLLVLGMMAAFGIGFQMPVVVALLSTIGIFSAKDMASVRRHVWFVIAIASAVITPSADVFSMLALMVPMALLFEVGLMAARVIEREREQPTT